MSNIPVIYEDEYLLIVDKPSGLLVIPTPKKEKRTLTSILGLYPCHRLDRETSGLIIYAKTKAVQQKMMEEFRQKRVKKVYHAFVRGKLNRPYGQINLPIENKSSITRYKNIANRRNFAIVEVRPETGRTNQIRIHFSRIGHPILGEAKFAFRRDFPVRAKRLMLHAQELEFMHPVTKKKLNIEIDLALDLQEFLRTHD